MESKVEAISVYFDEYGQEVKLIAFCSDGTVWNANVSPDWELTGKHSDTTIIRSQQTVNK